MFPFSRRYGPEPEPDVRKWQREHGESTGRSDLFLVITEGGEEIKIPVSRGVQLGPGWTRPTLSIYYSAN